MTLEPGILNPTGNHAKQSEIRVAPCIRCGSDNAAKLFQYSTTVFRALATNFDVLSDPPERNNI